MGHLYDCDEIVDKKKPLRGERGLLSLQVQVPGITERRSRQELGHLVEYSQPGAETDRTNGRASSVYRLTGYHSYTAQSTAHEMVSPSLGAGL